MRATTILVLLGLSAGTGCAGGSMHVGPAPASRSAGITVHVSNDHPADVRVFLLSGTTRIRIGSVGSFETRTLRLPAAAVGGGGTVALLIEAWGESDAQLVGPLDVGVGQELELRIAGNLAYSSLTPRF